MAAVAESEAEFAAEVAAETPQAVLFRGLVFVATIPPEAFDRGSFASLPGSHPVTSWILPA